MARIGVLDHPGPRSSHFRPIPKGGGVGIVAASMVGLALLGGPATHRAVLAGGGLLMAGLGYWDDRHDFPPLWKLAVQSAAAALPVAAGLVPQLSPWWAVNAAVVFGWMLLVTNAVNFMDGLNGLSAGTAAIAAAGFGWSGLTAGMIAGIIGFLPFNYPKARIFMGDVGSQFCGYAVGLFAVLGAAGPHPLLVPFALAGQLFDVLFTLARRFATGDRLTQAHRSHLYQIAHRTGVADWLVTLVYWGFAGWGVMLGTLPWHWWVAAGALAPELVWAGYVIGRARQVKVGKW